ncbi:MAG TPA: hypothetical protein VMU54_12760 [Planctomycetota bacterium]|nr:hypothetical protein [Planctomycetota bacterium]
MRDDFHKVVIERARWGSRMRNLKTGWSTSHYDPEQEYPFPARASSSWNWNPSRKDFSDRLGPLERYLGQQVGRPWRKVEGEFRKALDTSTIIGKHLWNHAERMVETEVRMTPDGRPLNLRGDEVRGLYVHPRTGILRRAKPARRDLYRERQERIARTDKIPLDPHITAEKVNNLWYLYIQEGRTEDVVEIRRDRSGRPLQVRVTRPVIRKKQANTQELRRIRAALERSAE